MERQNRARASNWAELEGRLRNELEESVIQNENLSKDRSEFKAKISRLERLLKERDDELAASRKAVEDHSAKIERLEGQLSKLESEATKRQEEYEQVERLANEGVARVRSEMTQTVVESEERYRGQIDKLEEELKVEKEKRSQLESQVDQLLENAGGMFGSAQNAPQAIRQESKPKKLRQSEGQAEILAGALGFDDSDDESIDDGDDELDEDMHNGVVDGGRSDRRGSSFAALEQLTSRLKTAEVELKSLRKSLRDSELTRESLVDELAVTRNAKEKLPLFEAKVKELTEDNREKELEIMGLKEDILEVKELYRTQLNILLEEKASENVQTTDRRHSSPADAMDPSATSASNDAASTPLTTVNEPVTA
jgi:TATA element modulatory factor